MILSSAEAQGGCASRPRHLLADLRETGTQALHGQSSLGVGDRMTTTKARVVMVIAKAPGPPPALLISKKHE